MSVIRLEGVCKSFGGVPVLHDITFEVAQGETLGLIGAGGAGKTLILKLICGLIEPDAGRIWVEGTEINRLTEAQRMAVRGRIGMIFQNYALFDYLTVGENIAFPLRQLERTQRGGARPGDIDARVARRLAQVHLPGIAHKLPSELSGGMKKRVCLARATVHDPPIMLCDDPTAGLDPVTTQRIFGLLTQLRAENAATALIVSHEVDALSSICDRLIMLEAGRLIFEGTANDARHGPAAVRRFVLGEGIE
jgi:phospholipid/cholesterol/gamma-HCH transport system ATP-binding protein